MTHNKLSPLAMGLAFGILWGVSILIIGLVAHLANYGTAFVTSMGVVYVGYGPSILGSIIGGIIGFIDAFILGAILIWLYNIFAQYGKKTDKTE